MTGVISRDTITDGSRTNDALAARGARHGVNADDSPSVARTMRRVQLTAAVFAATSVIVGLIWDISWHMTIGRDTFWTPAHLAIYLGGALAGSVSGFEVLRRLRAREPHSDGVTVWRVFNGPLGGWLCIWGAAAMLVSGPFDNWWHDAYGLDVKIISPPHSLLALGFIAILAGAIMLATAAQARDQARDQGSKGVTHASDAPHARVPWVVAYTCGLSLTMTAIFLTEFTDRVRMHSGIFYVVTALAFPFVLVTAARAVRLRYAATAVAAVYSAIMLAQLWILPLFAASPKLGPIRQQVTSMVPLSFPLLLLPAALAIDILLSRTHTVGAWRRALLLGAAFVLVFAALQWPFADFLMSESARNALFRTDRFAYMVPNEWLGPRHLFAEESGATLARAFALATVLATLSSRTGLAFGAWLRSVRR